MYFEYLHVNFLCLFFSKMTIIKSNTTWPLEILCQIWDIPGWFYEFLCHLIPTLLVSTGCLINIDSSNKSNLKGRCHIDGTPCTWHTPFEYRYSVWSSYLHYWSQYTLDAKVLLFGQIHITHKNKLVRATLNKPFYLNISAKEHKLSLIFTSGLPNSFK